MKRDRIFKFVLYDTQRISIQNYVIESRYIDTLYLDNGTSVAYDTLDKTYIDFNAGQIYMYSLSRNKFKDFKEVIAQYFKIMLKYYKRKQEDIKDFAKKIDVDIGGKKNGNKG